VDLMLCHWVSDGLAACSSHARGYRRADWTLGCLPGGERITRHDFEKVLNTCLIIFYITDRVHVTDDAPLALLIAMTPF